MRRGSRTAASRAAQGSLTSRVVPRQQRARSRSRAAGRRGRLLPSWSMGAVRARALRPSAVTDAPGVPVHVMTLRRVARRVARNTVRTRTQRRSASLRHACQSSKLRPTERLPAWPSCRTRPPVCAWRASGGCRSRRLPRQRPRPRPPRHASHLAPPRSSLFSLQRRCSLRVLHLLRLLSIKRARLWTQASGEQQPRRRTLRPRHPLGAQPQQHAHCQRHRPWYFAVNTAHRCSRHWTAKSPPRASLR